MAGSADSGQGGAGAGGYNIPISIAPASSYSVPQTLATPTYFLFNSAGATVGGALQAGAESYNPATATASAAQRDSQATTGAQSATIPSLFGGSGSNTWVYVAAISVVGIIAAIIVYKKIN